MPSRSRPRPCRPGPGMGARSPTTLRRAILIACLLLCPPPSGATAQSAGLAGGWSSLWNNEFDAAQQQFAAILASDSEDVSARRGLILALLAQGRERDAIEQIVPLSRCKQSGPLDLLLIDWVYSQTVTHGRDEKTFFDCLQQLDRKGAFDPFERRALRRRACDFALARADGKTAREVAGTLHPITAWSILGPFDNTSGSGHGKDYLESATRFEASDKYVGKAGQRLAWYSPASLDLAQVIEFSNCYERPEWSTVYAGVRLQVDRPGPYVLSLTKNGACVVVLDGTRLLDVDEASKQREYHHFTVQLDAGEHTLLVKVSGRTAAPELAAGISTPTGDVPPGLRCLPLAPGSLVSRPITFTPRALPGFDAIARAAVTETSDPAPAFWNLLTCAFFDLQETGRHSAEAAVARFPGAVTLRHVAALAFARVSDEDAWRSNMAEVAKLAPAHYAAVLWTAAESLKRRLFSQADSLLAASAGLNPQFLQARTLLLDSYSGRGDLEAGVATARALVASYPDYPAPHQYLAQYYRTLNPELSKQHERNALRCQAPGMALFQRLFEAGTKENLPEVTRRLGELVQLMPDSPMIVTTLARAKLERGDTGAIEMADAAAAQFPYIADAQLLKAQIEEVRSAVEPERKRLAIAAYTRALELNPADLSTRDTLRRLMGLKPVREILPPVDLEATRAASPDAAAYPGMAACVLLDETRRIVFDDGSSHLQNALVIKVLDDAGVERFSSLDTGLNPMFSDLNIVESRTIKPDGRQIEAQRLLGEVAFQAVSPGDILELVYESTSWSPGELGRHFWDSHHFGWDIPCLLSRYVLLTAEGRRVQWTLHNAPDTALIDQEETTRGDFKYRTWTCRNVAARQAEDLGPAGRDASPWVDVSTIWNWNLIAQWYWDVSNDPSKPDPRVRAKAEELLRGEQDADKIIQRVYDFVSNEVVYENLDFQYSAYIPERASRVLRAMSGDCKDKICLMRAMLSAAGIESFFALVNSADAGITPILPSPRFNHVVLAIPRGPAMRFLDPTAKGIPASAIPHNLEGAPVLIVRPTEGRLSTVPVAQNVVPTLRVDSVLQIQPGNQIVVRRHERYSDPEAVALLRDLYRGQPPQKQAEQLARSLSADLVGVSVDSLRWEGLASTGDSVVVTYEARVENGLSASGPLWTAKLPWRTLVGPQLASVVAKPVRKEPLLLRLLRTNELETLRLVLPEGWVVRGVPDTQAIAAAQGTFTIDFARGGRELVCRRNLRIFGDRVDTEQYPAFKTFLEQIIRLQNSVVILEGKPAQSATAGP